MCEKPMGYCATKRVQNCEGETFTYNNLCLKHTIWHWGEPTNF